MEITNVEEYEALANERLPKMVFDYYASDAEDQWTLRQNISAFSKILFRPYILIDVSNINMSTTEHSYDMLVKSSEKDIIEMIFFPVVNEACRVFAEGIAMKASDLDIAAVMGMGFTGMQSQQQMEGSTNFPTNTHAIFVGTAAIGIRWVSDA